MEFAKKKKASKIQNEQYRKMMLEAVKEEV